MSVGADNDRDVERQAPPQAMSGAGALDPSASRAPVKPGAVVDNIQVLRAVAAFMVVFHHIRDYANAQIAGAAPTLIGSAGVDIFFVISGFVMVLTAADGSLSPAEFVRRRLVRVVPLYWIFTMAMVALLLMGRHPVGVQAWSWTNLITSLLFLPQVRADGWEGPILAVGWTLNYEIFFYAIFALALLYARGRMLVVLVGTVFTALVTLGVVASIVGLGPSGYPFRFYTDPIQLEFFAGGVIALIYTGEVRLTASPLDPSRLRVVGMMLLAAGVLLLGAGSLTNPTSAPWREFVFGGPALLVVGGAVALEKTGVRIRARWALLLGAASYATYLSHVFVLQAVEKLSVKLLPQTYPVIVATALVGIGLVAVIGVLLHLKLELPLIRMLRSKPPPELRQPEMNSVST